MTSFGCYLEQQIVVTKKKKRRHHYPYTRPERSLFLFSFNTGLFFNSTEEREKVRILTLFVI